MHLRFRSPFLFWWSWEQRSRWHRWSCLASWPPPSAWLWHWLSDKFTGRARASQAKAGTPGMLSHQESDRRPVRFLQGGACWVPWSAHLPWLDHWGCTTAASGVSGSFWPIEKPTATFVADSCINRLDKIYQGLPGHNVIHCGQELLLPSALFVDGLLLIGEASCLPPISLNFGLGLYPYLSEGDLKLLLSLW